MARRRPHRASERGAALLMAVVSVAVLTALAVDLAYETQVRLRAAANARDALRAQALAESGVTMARLVVSVQVGLDDATKAAALPQGQLPGSTPTAGVPRPQIWNLIPVNTGLVQSLFGDPGAAAAGPSAAAPAEAAISTVRYGDFDGGFEARLEDEAQKIDLQMSNLLRSPEVKHQVTDLLRLLCDSKWDPLFTRDQADGQRYSRTDLVLHLRDWLDPDRKGSSLVAVFSGGNCNFEVGHPAFEETFSDEDRPYDRGRDRYKAKNARFDSLEELHLVAGVNDAFMAAFGERFTVYLPQGAKRKINMYDDRQLLQDVLSMAEPASRAAVVLDQTFLPRLKKEIMVQSLGGLFSIPPTAFTGMIEQLGVTVQASYRTTGAEAPFGDVTNVYRIRASGVAGDVAKTIDAVVSYDDKILPEQEKAPTMGRPVTLNPRLGALIRWREE
jgi:general secretion pathway protein K